MVLKRLGIGPVLVVVLTGIVVQQSARQAVAIGPGQYTASQSYNYYVPPDPNYRIGAQLYVSPRPTPPMVGHTYITYQPLAPHEFLYQHHRVYYTHRPDGRVTRTKVGWSSGLFPGAPFSDLGKFHDVPRLPIIGK